jgi:hypothetical protein
MGRWEWEVSLARAEGFVKLRAQQRYMMRFRSSPTVD